MLAHPGRYPARRRAARLSLRRLQGSCGVGVEVVTGSHTTDQFVVHVVTRIADGLLLGGLGLHGPAESRRDWGDCRPGLSGLSMRPICVKSDEHQSTIPESRATMFVNRVLSGMRPTGALHLGHYHGVLKNWVRLQHEYECLFFVADWHALTTHYDTPGVIEQTRVGHGDRLARRRRRSRAGDALHPVARAGARRAAPAAVDDHAARLARARADLQGPAGEARRQGPRRPTASSAIRCCRAPTS